MGRKRVRDRGARGIAVSPPFRFACFRWLPWISAGVLGELKVDESRGDEAISGKCPEQKEPGMGGGPDTSLPSTVFRFRRDQADGGQRSMMGTKITGLNRRNSGDLGLLIMPDYIGLRLHPRKPEACA